MDRWTMVGYMDLVGYRVADSQTERLTGRE